MDITTLNTSDTAQNNLIMKNEAWTYDFDGGHTWLTSLGHDKKDYSAYICSANIPGNQIDRINWGVDNWPTINDGTPGD